MNKHTPGWHLSHSGSLSDVLQHKHTHNKHTLRITNYFLDDETTKKKNKLS